MTTTEEQAATVPPLAAEPQDRVDREGDGQSRGELAVRQAPGSHVHALGEEAEGWRAGTRPGPGDRLTCGIYCTTDLDVINGYLSRGAPILGVVELAAGSSPPRRDTGLRARGSPQSFSLMRP